MPTRLKVDAYLIDTICSVVLQTYKQKLKMTNQLEFKGLENMTHDACYTVIG